MPISFPLNPSQGQVYTFGGRSWSYNGKGWFPITSNLLALTSSIVPAANVAYDLGATGFRWRDLYLSGNTLDLGGTAIKSTANGVSFTSAANAAVTIPLTVSSIQLASGGNVITLQATADGLATVGSSGNIVPIGGNGTTGTTGSSSNVSVGKNIVISMFFGG